MSCSESLGTASLYINNQLLSRGLLRDGQHIDFANPGGRDGDVAATMGRIMGVVNDLILRRDRDAEHRESLCTTLRSVRAESLRQVNDLQKLQEKHVAAERQVAIAAATETSLRSQLRAAEQSAQRLREESARVKVLAAQTRAACANESRKRDRQIDGLKKAVAEAGRARGATRGNAITTITVSGSPDNKGAFAVVGTHGRDGNAGSSTAIEDDTYDLRDETNAFLAELAKGLSEDNEALLDLIRRSILRLKEMSGLAKQTDESGRVGDGHALALQTDAAELAAEINGILEHLRTILTNPSFVPIEEVVVREDEIHRLRDGWVKMETRWEEAVHLIDGWRRRMQTSGRSVNMEELKMGLRLSPVRVKDVQETKASVGLRLSILPEEDEKEDLRRSAESLDLLPAPELEEGQDDSDAASSIFEDEVDVDDDLDADEPNVEILQQSSMLDSPPLPVPPQLSPLRDSGSAGNRGAETTGLFSYKRDRKGDMTQISDTNTWDLAGVAPAPPPHSSNPHGILVQPRPTTPPPAEIRVSRSSLDSILLAKPEESSTSTVSSKKAPRVKQETPVRSSRSATRAKQTQHQSPVRSNRQPTSTLSAAVSSVTSSTTSSAASTDMAPPPPPSAGRSPRRVNSRLPLPRGGNNMLPPPQHSPLAMATIAAKLAASERDADAARVRAKLKAVRLGGKTKPKTAGPSSMAPSETNILLAEGRRAQEPSPARKARAPVDDADELSLGNIVVNTKPPRKRERRTSKVANRRRSTLNPWEMEALIMGTAIPPAIEGAEEVEGY